LTNYGATTGRANRVKRRGNGGNFCHAGGDFTKIRQRIFEGIEIRSAGAIVTGRKSEISGGGHVVG
jgi:hypothetical protein